jgi:iron complex outermembrane receptor protein
MSGLLKTSAAVKAILCPTVTAAVMAFGLMTQASAQTAPASSAPNSELTEIVVTGSLLRRTTEENESPVTVFTAEAIKQTGLTTVSDVVRSISADNSGTIPTSFGAGFAAGASGVALRGLTVNSTLVLIDGRRAAPYALADDGERSFVDLNTIPLDSVERVEILKDGASSIYGADAIAGVVNVILKKQYQGAEVSAELGKGQHPGGNSTRVTGSFGKGDLETDRFNAYFNFEFQGDSRITAGDRPFPFNTTDLSSINGIDGRAGFPPNVGDTTTAVVAPAIQQPSTNPLLNGKPVGSYQLLNPAAGCTGPNNVLSSGPAVAGGGTDTYCLQNRAPYTDIQPAEQRIGASARFTIKLADTVDFYTNVSYYQNTVIVDGAPSAIQTSVPINTGKIVLPAVLSNGQLNPYDPFAASGQAAAIQYAFGDIQAQGIENNHNFRWVTGLRGQMWGWDFDTGLVINHTWLLTDNKGFLNGAGLFAAINNGTYNFANPSQNTAAQRAAVAPDLTKTSTTDLDSLDLKVTHDLFQLPGGASQVALGAEVRYEAQNDPNINVGNATQGLGAAQTVGTRRVEAAYFEFGVPVVKQLNIDLSGRYDHYSDFGQAFTPKAGFKFTPIEEVAIRGTYSKGFRAPAFAENGSSAALGFTTVNPATAFTAFPGVGGFCAPTYHSTAYCLPYTIGLASNANPNIRPEKSDSYTFGVIAQPFRQFSASVDYYYIKKTNVIEPPSTRSALTPYLAGLPIPAGLTVTPDIVDAQFPNSLARPAILSGVYQNANSLSTDGVDLDLRGNFEIGSFGKVTSDFSITKIFSFKLVDTDGLGQQWVGTQAPYNLSSGAGTPRYRATWSNGYEFGPFSATLTTYYVSGYQSTGVDATGDPTACLYTSNYCHTASFIDMDLTGIYKINSHLTTSLTIQNLADKLPPLNPANYGTNNYNSTYTQAGAIGRFFKIGAIYKF